MSVSYISPQACWEKLQEDALSVLIDVRTQAEWTYVGVPDLSSLSKELICVEWMQLMPVQALNKNFVDVVEHYAVQAGQNKEQAAKRNQLYFLCRSGQRSLKAAELMSANGWVQCFNVEKGFEGDLDKARQRGKASGWKAAGLPWIQG